MIDKAKDELKRVDHLIFVSLKYTRTIDVINSVIDRLINTLKFGIEALLEYLKKKRKIKEIPKLRKLKVEIIKEKFKENKEIQEFLEFYQFLERISRAKHLKKEEFRKNVALIALEKGKEIANVDILTLKEYYTKGKDYIEYIDNLTKGVKEYD